MTGEVIDLNTYGPIREVYGLWDGSRADPAHANLVAASVKALLSALRPAYPDLESIVIAGDDDVIPFRRIPDEATIANESSYNAFLPDGSPLAASLKERYFLSDAYYAGFAPFAWRGRELTLPDTAIGRLVETPEEMAAAIDGFMQRPVLAATTGLAVGYDFLKDQAELIAQEMEAGGLAADRLINDHWTAADLRQAWLENRHDLDSINAHFAHWKAIPADGSGQVLTPADVLGSQHVPGTVVFSVGCHSGLPVPDEQAAAHKLDFAQVLVGKGATYLANTGYGYGDANAIGYSERLMTLFARHLRAGGTVGQALRAAEIEYFNTIGIRSLTPYDEKVLAVATLFGLPMLRVQLLGAGADAGAAAAALGTVPDAGQLRPAPVCPEGLECRRVVITPHYDAPHTVTAGGAEQTYYSIDGATQVAPGQPVQPRTGISITLAGATARGALFEGGRYETLPSFSPVLTHIASDDVSGHCEGAAVSEERLTWAPSAWALINSVRTPAELRQQLIVIPAQYRATDAGEGTERLISEMSYTVYYSNLSDVIPPSIWTVRASAGRNDDAAQLRVDVTDFSGIVRVTAAYTTGNGEWRTTRLVRARGGAQPLAGAPAQPVRPNLFRAGGGRGGKRGAPGQPGAVFRAQRPPAIPATGRTRKAMNCENSPMKLQEIGLVVPY